MFGRFARTAQRAARVASRLAASGPARNASSAAYSALMNGGKAGAMVMSLTAASLGFAPMALAASPVERSFIAVKPDGVHRGLVSEIIRRFEAKGYKLVAIKIIVPSKGLASSHYAEHDGKPFFPKLVNFLSSGPVVAMVWEGKDVIKYGRTMIGATNPLASAPGTIRGDYGVDVGRNIIHGSDSVDSAQREIALWFKPDEIAEWTPAAKAWIYE